MTTQLFNYTPNTVKLRNLAGSIRVFEPEDFTPQYEMQTFSQKRMVPYLDGFKAQAAKRMAITNFKLYDPFKAYIVPYPILIMAAHQGRFDFFSPDYKNDPVRDEDGNIIACSQLISLVNQGTDLEEYAISPFLRNGLMPAQAPFGMNPDGNYIQQIDDSAPFIPPPP